jgi:hypothetical protein
VKIQARDIIAAIALIGAFTLMALGIDHLVGAVISTVVVFYFGHSVYERRNRKPPGSPFKTWGR